MDEWGDPISEFIQWYKSRPIIAKSYIAACLLLAILIQFNVFGYMDLYYTFENNFGDLQLWRMATCFFYLGGVGFALIIKVYLAYLILFYSQTTVFSKEHLADYLMTLIFNSTLLVLISSIYDLYFLNDAFLFSLLFVGSRLKPFLMIKMVFGIDLEAKWFIWVYAGFNVLMGAPPYHFLAGWLVGYLYVQIKTTISQKYRDYWPTPAILTRLAQAYVRWGEGGEELVEGQDDLNDD